MSRTVVLCGVPEEHCTAGYADVSSGLRKHIKAHANPEDAFRCMRHYLVKVLGYTQIGAREFRPPDGSPITVLTKRSRYGGRLRRGKMGRSMPGKRTGGCIYSI